MNDKVFERPTENVNMKVENITQVIRNEKTEEMIWNDYFSWLVFNNFPPAITRTDLTLRIGFAGVTADAMLKEYNARFNKNKACVDD